MTDSEIQEKRKVQRQLLEAEVIFDTEEDIFISKSVDISEKGIRIVTDNPIDFRIQVKENNEQVLYSGQLVWARQKEDGSMEYGLKY